MLCWHWNPSINIHNHCLGDGSSLSNGNYSVTVTNLFSLNLQGPQVFFFFDVSHTQILKTSYILLCLPCFLVARFGSSNITISTWHRWHKIGSKNTQLTSKCSTSLHTCELYPLCVYKGHAADLAKFPAAPPKKY